MDEYVNSMLAELGRPTDDVVCPTDPDDPTMEGTDEEPEPKRRDLVAFCVRNAMKVLQEQDPSVQARDGQSEQPEYKDAVNVDLSVRGRSCKPGWAVRPKLGTRRGKAKNVPVYLKRIGEKFAAEGMDKQHPSWYLTALVSEFPNRYDHPTEQEVRNIIIRCIAYKRKVEAYNATLPPEAIVPDYATYLVEGKSQLPTARSGGGGGPRSQMPADQEDFIQANSGLTAAECYALALQQDFTGAIDEKRFKRRVTNVRAALKRMGR